MTNVQVSPPACFKGTCACVDKSNCGGNQYDFLIKRHDTKPSFVISITDDAGELMDLTGLVLEASMWSRAKLKNAIIASDTSIALAGNIGFEQILPNDVIIMDRIRDPEQMLVVGFDEANKLVLVERGFNGTAVSSWARNQCLRMFRFMGSPGVTEMLYDDVLGIDGCTKNMQTASNLIYEWQPNDTCVPGCYFLEFKLMMMGTDVPPVQSENCSIGQGVEWVRRFPDFEGFRIKIADSPTAE